MMKKGWPVLLFLALCLLLTACSKGSDNGLAENTAPAAQDYDSRIDAAFAAGKFVLKEAELPKPDPDACVILMPPEDGQFAYPDEAEIREALRTGKLTVLAYSPDGKTAVAYVIPDGSKAQFPLIISGDQVRMIYPSASRGAGNADGGLYKYYSDFYGRFDPGVGNPVSAYPLGIDYHGLVWSPDGRYYYAQNYQYNFLNSKSVHFICDTQTGELVSLDSFTSETWEDGNFGILHGGCFSPDGQYFYAALMSRKYGDDAQNKIVRYDLNTWEATRLASLESLVAAMEAFRNGDVMVLEWQNRSTESERIVRIRPDGSVTAHTYPQPAYIWYGREIVYSPKSGWAVIRGDSQLSGQYSTSPISGLGIQPFMPESAEKPDMESALFVDNETRELVYAPIMERFYADGGTEAGPRRREYNGMAFQILDLDLSPDGRYAAMLVFRFDRRFGNGSELYLMIVRLEDRACLVAEGLDIYEEQGAWKMEKGQIVGQFANSKGLHDVINWTEAGLLTNCSKTQLWVLDN